MTNTIGTNKANQVQLVANTNKAGTGDQHFVVCDANGAISTTGGGGGGGGDTNITQVGGVTIGSGNLPIAGAVTTSGTATVTQAGTVTVAGTATVTQAGTVTTQGTATTTMGVNAGSSFLNELITVDNTAVVPGAGTVATITGDMILQCPAANAGSVYVGGTAIGGDPGLLTTAGLEIAKGTSVRIPGILSSASLFFIGSDGTPHLVKIAGTRA